MEETGVPQKTSKSATTINIKIMTSYESERSCMFELGVSKFASVSKIFNWILICSNYMMFMFSILAHDFVVLIARIKFTNFSGDLI